MSAGLFGLLDDVAALARLAAASLDDVGAAAAKATAKAAGVVIDDTAVTPQYVHGIAAERELPIIKKIAIGSLRNKLLFILPAALLLSEFLPRALPVLLILGGTYLAFEGAEKIWERIAHHDDHVGDLETVDHSPHEERELVAGAVRTDFILSTEIMVIALDSVADESFWSRLAILVVVAIVITIGVYGVVAAIVKMDDAGLLLSQRRGRLVPAIGRGLVAAMPKLLATLSTVGIAAMLWVGGHILLVQAAELGWHAPEHHVQEWAHHFSGILVWLVETFIALVVGVVVGAIVVVLMHLVSKVRPKA